MCLVELLRHSIKMSWVSNISLNTNSYNQETNQEPRMYVILIHVFILCHSKSYDLLKARVNY